MTRSLIRAKQRSLTAILPHNANRRFAIPRRGDPLIMTAGDLGGVQTGFSTIFVYGALAPADFRGLPVMQIHHNTNTLTNEVILGSTPGQLGDTFWHSIRFQSVDANWNDFTLLRETRTIFDDSDPSFALWGFANRNVPFLTGVVYDLYWR